MKLRFLADVNIEKGIVDCLQNKRYDVKWIPNYNCGMNDEDLLKLAKDERRILITNDKDFGELTFLQKKISVGIILFRVKDQDSKKKAELMEKLITNFYDKILNNFIVITNTKFRFIPMEKK